MVAAPGRDEGLLIVTMIETDNAADESAVLDRFWNSFQVNQTGAR